ncbi:MAG: hypothetical protein ACREL7_01220 [Longimicrobiales bacterium]
MTDDWFDVLVALLGADARFLVVGAHAMAVHGVPRATQDLDVWIESSEENAGRVWDALVDFGAPLGELGTTVADFVPARHGDSARPPAESYRYPDRDHRSP